MSKAKTNNPKSLENLSFVITTRTILLGILLIAVIWLILKIKLIILSLFVAVILALALEPIVEWMMKKRVPKVPSVIITVLGVLTLLVIFSIIAVVPMFKETGKLLRDFPGIIEQYAMIPEYNSFITDLNTEIDQNLNFNTAEGGFKVLFGTLSNISSGALAIFGTVISILFFTVYILLDFNNFRELFINLFPPENRSTVKKIVLEVESKLGMWLRGQVILMLAVGLITYIGLYIIEIFIGDVAYLESIALIAGILEIVPIIGPIVASVFAVLIGFTSSPVVGISILILFIIIQQAENSILVPKVMERAVGFRPIVTMVAILAGGNLFGVMGALLAVPISLIITIIFQHIYSSQS